MLATSNEYRDVFIPYWEHLEVYHTFHIPSLIIGVLIFAGTCFFPDLYKFRIEGKVSWKAIAALTLIASFLVIFPISFINELQGRSKIAESRDNIRANIAKKYDGVVEGYPMELSIPNNILDIPDPLPSEVLPRDHKYKIRFTDDAGNVSGGVYNVRFDPNTIEPFISDTNSNIPSSAELESRITK